jgi:hypothetical protein
LRRPHTKQSFEFGNFSTIFKLETNFKNNRNNPGPHGVIQVAHVLLFNEVHRLVETRSPLGKRVLFCVNCPLGQYLGVNAKSWLR